MDEQRDLSVRRATNADLDAVARIWHASASSMDGAAADMPSRAALRHRIDAELESGWELHVALCGGLVAGMLALKPADATLDQIFVAPGGQGKGVGRALLDVAKQKMPAGFTLRMAATNEKARRFYENEGLRRTGDGIHPRTGGPVHFYGWNVR